MLRTLQIENIAVIEHAEITFDRGFNVLTGETGAGKSIVIDAISAIAGERTYREVIRTGAEKAYVSGIFTGTPELNWFEENAVPYDPETILQRELYADGRNLCRVNGRTVSVALLRDLGRQLINIHGQHDAQQLFDERFHLQYLDLYAEDQDLLDEYRRAYDRMMQTKQELDRLSMNEGEKQRRMEMLQYQISELERAKLRKGEDETLLERKKLLQNAEKLSMGIADAYAALYGDDENGGALELLADAEHSVSQLGRLTDAFDELKARLTDLRFAAEEAASLLRDAKEEMEFSDDDLEQIESRLNTIQKLKKYGANVEEMLAYLSDAKKELEEIEFSSDTIERLTKQLHEQEAAAGALAGQLHEVRAQAGLRLGAQLQSELQQLAMPRIAFECVLESGPLGPSGSDSARFLMSANAGEALRPINKVASGGELARIMLAMKNVLSERDQVGTLIFDEVDTGVSGKAAQKVAEKLYSVSIGKQVLCVTHLPQLASMADVHFSITKEEHGGRTYTTVSPLDRQGRREELARLTGGAEVTQTLLASAEEMLRASDGFHSKFNADKS